MKLNKINIHNIRSILTAEIEAMDYMLLVGPNNAGKSNLLNAIRIFYDDIKWTSDDFPKVGAIDNESWVELQFRLDANEWLNLADQYKEGISDYTLTVRRYFKSDDKTLVQKDQSNIYGYINGELSKDQFYGAKNVGTAKVGQILYVPALTTPSEQTKLSGPSPLRNMINFLLKKVVSKSKAYQEVSDAFEKLNAEARQTNGFLSEISSPLNQALSNWQIQIDLSVNTVAPEDISKNLVKFDFIDQTLSGTGFDLDRYGHGFQRSVIYELIRLAPTFKDDKKIDKKEFNPAFNLILFEEPEAFLHPSQQESMAYHLRRMGSEDNQQVIITTHSPIFAGKAANQINQIIRIQRLNGVSAIFQPKAAELDKIFEQGGNLLMALKEFLERPGLSNQSQRDAKDLIANSPSADIAEQEEIFRFQLWLDGDRSTLFFANKVLIVEGATEKALFNYLLANEWGALSEHHICIIDALGKYNFHRYMGLMKAYGIPHGVILDDDNEKNHHLVVNELIEKSANKYTLNPPIKLQSCLEIFLALPMPTAARADRKVLEILKAVTSGKIAPDKLNELKEKFCAALAI
jgi:predicted ATP-dependent endonuclease of OLD family